MYVVAWIMYSNAIRKCFVPFKCKIIKLKSCKHLLLCGIAVKKKLGFKDHRLLPARGQMMSRADKECCLLIKDQDMTLKQDIPLCKVGVDETALEN